MINQTPRRTIVVGFDGSPAARAAVDHAIDRALPDGRIVLVHAYPVPGDYIGASYYNVMLEDTAMHASSMLDDIESACPRLSTVEHVRDVVTGSAAAAIARAAEIHDADEIVIGSRGVGRVRGLLGSVAHEVIHRARCPVTVIPGRMVASTPTSPVVTAGAG